MPTLPNRLCVVSESSLLSANEIAKIEEAMTERKNGYEVDNDFDHSIKVVLKSEIGNPTDVPELHNSEHSGWRSKTFSWISYGDSFLAMRSPGALVLRFITAACLRHLSVGQGILIILPRNDIFSCSDCR
jgi:hypothetical protein